MVWKCPPLHLPNWNNHWKWKIEMSKKSIKLDSFHWIAENGAIEYGFYFGDTDEPIQFSTTLKELVRDTIEAYRLPSGLIADCHQEDMQRLINSLKAAQNIIQHQLNRFEGIEDND